MLPKDPLAFSEVPSQMRSMTLDMKLLLAPCRRKLPISSSSKHPTILMMPGELSSEDASSASIAAQEQSLSSMRPAKINSLSKPPSFAGCVSKGCNYHPDTQLF